MVTSTPRPHDQNRTLNLSVTVMAEYYIRLLNHLRNHTHILRKMDRELGQNNEMILNMLNITHDEIQTAFNESRESTKACYCDGTLLEIATAYQQLHGYLSLIVCLFGSIANMLNIVVLTRKELAGTPINRILTGIAVADLLVMLEYIPFTTYSYLYRPRLFSWAEAVYVLVHMHFSQLLHTVSVFLTLTLALWRYLALQYPHHSQTLCLGHHWSLVLGLVVLLSALICLPYYFVFSIQAIPAIEDHQPVVLYHVDLSDLAKADDERLYTYSFWMYAVIMKLLPCTVLTVISFGLIKVLWRVKSRKERLRLQQIPPADCEQIPRRTYKPDRRVDRTTNMLVAVLILFLLTEIPKGILGLLSGILGRCFFKNCYNRMGEIMDILALTNGGINFILYCSMSTQFRLTFSKMFKPKLLDKCAPTNIDVQSTYV